MKHRGNKLKNGLRIICATGIIGWCSLMQPSPQHNIRIDVPERLRHAAADRGLPPHRISGDAVLRFFMNERGAGSSSIQWTPLSAPNFSGRITALAISPQHPDTVLAGAADGGIWRSTDGGGGFSPVFDFAPTLSIGSLAFDPVQPNIAYAGTGEANANLDSYPGTGIFKSTDAGATWVSSGLSSVPYISSIVVNPDNTSELFVAGMGGLLAPDTIGGVFHSTDGGNSWAKIFSPGDSVGVIDLQYLRMITPIWLCATWQRLGGGGQSGARSAIYRSTDMGTSWEKVTKGLPKSDSLTGRIAIAPSRSTPNVVYTSFEEFSPLSDYGGVYRSTDAGSSWSAVSSFPGNLADFYQGWYDKVLAVNPLNDNCVLFGDQEMYYTADAGTTWTNISNAYSTSGNTHPDQHAIAYDLLDTAAIFAGNDGGIYKIRFDSAWRFLPVPVTQFYSSAIDTNRQWFAIGGTQDNGLLLYNDTATADWVQPRALLGDIASVTVNPSNAGTIFAEHTYMRIVFTGDGIDKSTDSGASWINLNTAINGNDYAAAVPPLAYDARDTNVLYAATNRIYRTTDAGATWSSISPRLTSDTLGSITALAMNAGSVIFVAGASDGTVSVSTNGGNKWIIANSPVPGRWITSLAYDDRSGALYAGSASGVEGSQTLYRSTNLGATWQSISTLASGFPPAAVNSIIVDDKYDSIIIAGTDIGVYATRNLGAAWKPLGAGLPHAAVVQMNFNRRTRMLRAATHGRDMWQFDLGAWEQGTSVHKPVPENNTLDLQAYPDPFTNTVTVSLSSTGVTNEASQFEIVDLNGAVQRMYKGDMRSVSFDVSSLPSGVYVARARSGAWSATRKVLLVR